MSTNTRTSSHNAVTRYKTELCRSFTETGHCKYGNKCQFSHGLQELRLLMRHPKYKTQLCRTFHSTGFCPYGFRCHFIHENQESRSNQSYSIGLTNSNLFFPSDFETHRTLSSSSSNTSVTFR